MPYGVATQTGGKVTRRERRMAVAAFSKMVTKRSSRPRPAGDVKADLALDESSHDMPGRCRLARKAK